MKNKKRLGSKKIYIDHKLTVEEKQVRRKMTAVVKEKMLKKNEAKASYRKMWWNVKL